MNTAGSTVRALTFVTLLGALSATTAKAQITGSKHDFSGEAWSAGEICVVCHTPHDALGGSEPLWNHEVTQSAFQVYSSPTMDQQPTQPGGNTKLCLSCHDGVVAINSFGGMTGSDLITGDAELGIDLRDDHPVSVAWDHQTELPSCQNCHSSHGPLTGGVVPFFQGRVECASCHDVHNGTGLPYLLRKTLTGSQLCLHCHGK